MKIPEKYRNNLNLRTADEAIIFALWCTLYEMRSFLKGKFRIASTSDGAPVMIPIK